MKVVASDLYNVAWFKLADFVARGEKERALSVHKLLMHSVADAAIPYQLEGDILLAFDDSSALDRYHIAANLYKKSGKMKQAASVYEHVCMFKQDIKILEALFDVYLILQDYEAMLITFTSLAQLCLKKDDSKFILHLFHRSQIESDKYLQAKLWVQLIKSFILYDDKNSQFMTYLYQALDLLQETRNEEELLKLLTLLEDFDTEYYKKAQLYVDK